MQAGFDRALAGDRRSRPRAAVATGDRGGAGGLAEPANPCPGPGSGDLLCPDLGSGPPPTSTSSSAAAGGYGYGRRGALLHAGNDIRSRGRGPMELRGRRYKRNWMRANQAIYRVGGGVEIFRTDDRSTSTTSATSAAAPTGRSTTR